MRVVALVSSLLLFGCASGDATYLTLAERANLGLPYSDAVRAGELLFLSGTVGTAPGTRTLVEGGVQAETRQALENIKVNLERHGSSLDRAVKCTVFLANIGDFEAMNAVYREYFPANKPARTTVGVAGLPLGARVEIECLATAGRMKAATPAAAASAPAPRRLFTFQSNFWLNLHHFLRVVARGEPAPAQLSADERRIWDEAVAAYKAKYIERDLVRDEGMVAIKETLRLVANDAALPEIPNEPELKALLERAAPIYRNHFWPAHDTLNRGWIAGVQPLLARWGERLAREVAASYDTTWPETPVPVDLSITAGPVGAYTTSPPVHATIASPDHGYSGLFALEMVFHEASHQWGRRLFTTINDAAQARGKTVPRGLWHAVLFYNTAELTRRALAAGGYGTYIGYAGNETIYDPLCGKGCGALVAKHWKPRLDGSISLATALQNLVAEWPEGN